MRYNRPVPILGGGRVASLGAPIITPPPDPPAGGFASRLTVGVQAVVTDAVLGAHTNQWANLNDLGSANITTTEHDQVIELVRTTGTITVNHHRVIVRNVAARRAISASAIGSDWANRSKWQWVSVGDHAGVGVSGTPASSGFYGFNAEVRRCESYGTTDTVRILGGRWLIADCWLHDAFGLNSDTGFNPPVPSHKDMIQVVQSTGWQIPQLDILDNLIDAWGFREGSGHRARRWDEATPHPTQSAHWYDLSGSPYRMTTGILVHAGRSPGTNIDVVNVDGNMIDGNMWAVQTYMRHPAKLAGALPPQTVNVTNNGIKRRFNGTNDSTSYGARALMDHENGILGQVVTHTGNYDLDDLHTLVEAGVN